MKSEPESPPNVATRIRLRVGSVTVDLSGFELTPTQIRSLLNRAAAIAVTVESPPELEPEALPIGFTVITERAEPPAPDPFYSDE